MQPRTIRALALQPDGNVQGGFNFYNLSSGDIISCRSWTPLPMQNMSLIELMNWQQQKKLAEVQYIVRERTFRT